MDEGCKIRNQISKDAFNNMDINKSNCISRNQIYVYINGTFNKNIIDAHIEQLLCIRCDRIFDAMNIASDAKINVNQFQQFMHVFNFADDTNLDSLLFYAADTNFYRSIDQNQLRGMFEKLNISADNENVQIIMNNLGERQFDYPNYLRFIFDLRSEMNAD
ncbi:EF_hand domain-containing protein [Hexamita inflata]|uniref:EF hand domain-containing protein n=1 Tax=Hexamita inflata TaxID=28002 RepID=A0AA86REN6_9EUKA|nr:EF hand domain-containing protein [Hexamita inflata]